MANWSTEDDAKLKKWFLEGLTASQMSARLADDRSRNAVIGRLSRLGLKRGGNYQRDNKPTHQRRVPPRQAPRRTAPRPAYEPEPFVPENRIVRPANAKRITVQNVEKHHCRFVHGDPATDRDWTFCGEKIVPGQAWCKVHYHVAFKPVPPRQIQPDPRLISNSQINAEIARVKKELQDV
jgi:GcrA cell cycle regulator